MANKLRWFAALGAVIALGAGVAPWTLSDSALKREIARQASDATGFETTAQGRAIFALLPRPRLKIENFHARSGDGAITVEADFLRGDLRVLPMIAGGLELANASLISPKIDIDLDRLMAAGPPAAGAARDTASNLGAISIVDGEATLHSAGHSWRTKLDHVDLALDWRGVSAPVTANGSFSWLGDMVETSLWIGKPQDALAGVASPLVAKFDGPALSLSLDGTAAWGPSPRYDGKIAANAASVGRLASRLGAAPAIADLGSAGLDGTARLDSKGLSLSGARLTIAGARFDGALSLATSAARPALSGTLATETMDLTPLAALLPRLSSRGGGWSEEPLPFVDLGALDVDLRLSATNFRLGRLTAQGTGVSILCDAGRLEASLVDAKAFGGDIKGGITATRVDDGYGLRAQATFAGVDMAAMLFSPRQIPRLSGQGLGTISVESSGSSVASLLRSLRGTSSFELRGGGIGGVDLEQALRRIERRPLSIASELRGGKTTFSTATFAVDIDKGIATLQRADGASAGVAFNLSGNANIPERSVSLRLRAWPANDNTDAATVDSGLALTIDGPWDGPSLGLDAQNLIKRSRAAAPLWGDPQPPSREPAAAQAQ